MITREDYITASGKYKDRLKSPELTPEVEANIVKLLKSVNDLLKELGLENVKISSGFRDSSTNRNTPNSAKKSYHMRGMAIDIFDDKKQTLASLILSKPALLKKCSLWIEDPANTVGKYTNWVHLDIGTRTDRPIRKFIP